jgi:ketosteroid isomerase-like protein
MAACAEQQVVPPPPPPPPPVVVAPPPEPPPPPPKPSLTDLERATFTIVLAGYNAHDAAKAASGYADDALVRVAGSGDIEGRAAVQANAQEWFDTFSNIKLAPRRVWMFGDMVATEWVMNGNYAGTALGTKGKDQPVGYVGLSLMWFDDEGRVKEEHRYADFAIAAKQVSGKTPIPAIPEIPAAPQVFSPAADTATNVDVARSVYGAIENKNEKDLLARLTDDVTLEGPFGKASGKTDAKKFFATFARAFPDAKLTITNAWGTADGAIVEYVLTGTFRGPIAGLSPLNRAIAIHAVDVMKLADGKVSTIATDSNGPAELVPPVAVKASMQVASKGEKAPSTPPAPKKK